MNNLQNRIKSPKSDVVGVLVGENLLDVFKSEMIKERVFQRMFGTGGERIYINEMPNVNETITPFVLASWSKERFNSIDTYFEGNIDVSIVLPTQIKGDYNALRHVGAMFQRWIGTTMNCFDKVLGLIEFGANSDYDYNGLAVFSGANCPVIKINMPFKFDLQKISHGMSDEYGFDPLSSLDDAQNDVILERYGLIVVDAETDNTLLTTEDNIEQT